MGKHGKRYQEAAKLVEHGKTYDPEEAMSLLKQTATTKFDGSVEAHIRLGVDPRHADQMVRGTVVLPHGTGKKKKVLVIAAGDKLREAEEALQSFFLRRQPLPYCWQKAEVCGYSIFGPQSCRMPSSFCSIPVRNRRQHTLAFRASIRTSSWRDGR